MSNDEKKSSLKSVSPASGEQDSKSSSSNADHDYGIPNFAFPDIMEGGSFTQNNDPRDTLAAVEASLDIPRNDGTGWENGDSVNAEQSSNDAPPLKDDDHKLTEDNKFDWENDNFANAEQSSDDAPPLKDDDHNLTEINKFDWENDNFPNSEQSSDNMTLLKDDDHNLTEISGSSWDNGDSVNAEQTSDDMATLKDDDHDLTDLDNKSSGTEATVMPFPGMTIPRPSEMEPSEMLRGKETVDDDFLEASTDDYTEESTDLEQTGSDAIADAVQSALQNVYGNETEAPPPEPSVPDFGQFSVAESLRQDAAAQAATQGAYWHDDDDNVENAHGDGGDTETVLDYLYSNRRAGPERLQEPQSPSPNDYSGFGAANPDVGGNYYGHQQDARNSHGYDDDPDWAPPSFVTSSSSETGQYPAPMTTANPESLAEGSPDSSHLLGAAGLGLIGGIALAGVLAVFVFNSFVEENDPSVSPGVAATKVIERLDGEANADETVITANGTSETTIPGPNAAPAKINETRQAAIRSQPVVVPEPEVVNIAPEPEKPLSALDVTGLSGTEIPLNIKMSDELSRQAALLSLKGLTENCKLSTGIDVGAGQWLLPTARLSTLTVTTPQTLAGTLDIEIQLLKDDAQTPVSEPVSFKLVVNAPQQAVASESAALSQSNEQATQLVEATEATAEINTDPLTQLLIRDGNNLMRKGDILGARRLYEQAAANGNPEAALAMGRSYDPSYFEKLPVQTGKPDPATAFQWYKQALDGGLVTARVKIDGLKQWLQQ